jgi:Pyruvate/2-oxoacid:ferredoxin oxidoreductase delta subunit
MESAVETDVARIGLVFPVYAWGMPRMMAEFAERLNIKKEQYVFAVATCGGTMGGTLRQLQHILRRKGRELHAGFAVKDASNSSMKAVPVQMLVRWFGRKTQARPVHDRIGEIVTTIRQRQRHAPETSAMAASVLGTTLLHNTVMNVFKTSDKDFWVNENCTQCGTCARICPRQNVTLERNGVTWHQNCEFCLGCLNWCPQAAIRHKAEVPAPARYQHPEVKLHDVLLR